MAPVIPGQCCIPPPVSDYKGVGREDVWDDLSVYLTGSTQTQSAVVFIVDIYGWQVPQTRYLADKIAATGHFVVVGDYLRGDYFASLDPNEEYAGLPEFLARHSKPAAIAAAKKVVARLRAPRDSDSGGLGFARVGVVGNCWGAKIAISLLDDAQAVQGAVFNHPSFLTEEEVRAVRVPLAILAAEIDIVTTPEEALRFGGILESNPDTPRSFVKVFPGADHGWTTRYDLDDAAAAARAQEAHTLLLDWLHSTLHVAQEEESEGKAAATATTAAST